MQCKRRSACSPTKSRQTPAMHTLKRCCSGVPRKQDIACFHACIRHNILVQGKCVHLLMEASSCGWKLPSRQGSCLWISSATCAPCGGQVNPAQMVTTAQKLTACKSSGGMPSACNASVGNFLHGGHRHVDPSPSILGSPLHAGVPRMQAAMNQQILKDVYKTQRCSKLHCKGPLGTATCWFFHCDQDQLKPVGYKSQFCKTWKVRIS